MRRKSARFREDTVGNWKTSDPACRLMSVSCLGVNILGVDGNIRYIDEVEDTIGNEQKYQSIGFSRIWSPDIRFSLRYAHFENAALGAGGLNQGDDLPEDTGSDSSKRGGIGHMICE